MKRDFWDWLIILILAVIGGSLGYIAAFIITRALEAL